MALILRLSGVYVHLTGEKASDKIETCDFTRHDSIQVRFYIVGENADIDIADSVPFDCATFRSAQNITGLKVLVDTLANTNLVTGKQFPTRLKQGE